MYKRIVLFFVFLCMADGLFAQENDTTKVEKPAKLPEISYTLSPRKYKIADIQVNLITSAQSAKVLIYNN